MRWRWWVLGVLVGVSVVHGIQCAGHDLHPQSRHGVATTLAAVPLPPLPGAVDLPFQHEPAAVAVPEHAGHAAAPSLVPGATPPLTADLWAVCLAALAAGLALLAARALPARRSERLRSSRAAVRRWTDVAAPLRPPDLFALCVLRN